MTTPSTNAVKTPDQDEAQDWYVTKASIISAFLGDLGSLRFASRVDVQYPSGWISRFIVTSYTPPKNGEQANLDIIKIGSPALQDSVCKPQ